MPPEGLASSWSSTESSDRVVMTMLLFVVMVQNFLFWTACYLLRRLSGHQGTGKWENITEMSMRNTSQFCFVASSLTTAYR